VDDSYCTGIIHVSQLDALVEMREAPPLASPRPLKDFERKIGKNIAQLIPDEACLQMGIGAIPDAVLFELGNHKDIGIHTEMFSNGVIHLVEKGVITNKKKRVLPGQIAVSFVMGDEALYKFVDDNPQVYFSESTLINDPNIIRRNPKQIAINSSIEIDLTGQVVSDSMGTKMYSGVGGQVDFVRGSALSEGGKSIIGMSSVTSRGETRIVPTIKEGMFLPSICLSNPIKQSLKKKATHS
jgi:acyl-CoA hydrolase